MKTSFKTPMIVGLVVVVLVLLYMGYGRSGYSEGSCVCPNGTFYNTNAPAGGRCLAATDSRVTTAMCPSGYSYNNSSLSAGSRCRSASGGLTPALCPSGYTYIDSAPQGKRCFPNGVTGSPATCTCPNGGQYNRDGTAGQRCP